MLLYFSNTFKICAYMSFKHTEFGTKLEFGKLQNETIDIFALNDKNKIK